MNTLLLNHPGIRTALLALALVIPGRAQGARIQIQALDKLAAQASEVVDVTLEGPTLKMAARFLEKDPETRLLVQNLKGVYVKSFEFEKPDAYPRADVEAIRAQLQGPGWARIVGVREKQDKEVVEVYLMADPAGNPLGMAVLVMEPQELTVVNIVGAIDLERLSAMEGKFGIPKLHEGKHQGSGHDAKR
jgi:cellobiose-specific phosphotransferase system component IIB